MNKPQWLAAGIVILLIAGLYLATSPQIFGAKEHAPASTVTPASNHQGELTIDTILLHARENLTQLQQARLNSLNNSLKQASSVEKIHLNHQLARYWKDSVRMFEPYAWYTAEASRLENSEKSLTFAAHLFLSNLKGESSPELKHWKAHQATDLFERSLKLNPANDSSAVGLGAVHLFGGMSDNPMEGIQRIRSVLDKDPDNVFALMTLGHASVLSGQMDKAIERFNRVAQLQPQNLEAVLSLADAYERKGDRKNAIVWYQKSLSLDNIPGLKEEVERRIKTLSQ